MALHIFNMSVDMPDAQPDNVPEDLTQNDIESVVELLLEDCFGIDNAIAEHDEPDAENGKNFEISKEIDFYTPHFPLLSVASLCKIKDGVQTPFSERKIAAFVSEIIPPPPKRG